MEGAKKSPLLSWIRVSWQHPWVSVTPSLGVHFGKLGACESSEGCEYFGRNMIRCVSPELLWVCVPFALLQGVKQTGKAAKSLQAEFFSDLDIWIYLRFLLNPLQGDAARAFCCLPRLRRLDRSVLKGGTVHLLPFSQRKSQTPTS